MKRNVTVSPGMKDKYLSFKRRYGLMAAAFKAGAGCGRMLGAVITVCCLIFCPLDSTADIYRYIDRNGVVHFTNTPTEPGYVLYMKEKQENAGGGNTTVVYDSDAYDAIIKSAGSIYGVDFFLIKAVIRAESGFDPQAVSKKGAKGLMQIMPENFQSLSIDDPFDPAQNILGGTCYLKKMMDRYDNNLTLALAAYNAGPTAVDKYRKIPPYEETQTYVRKVMTFYSEYKNA